ncbi:MAG TPA: glycosyltransferase family 4 protein, partial [Candidatus Acidoferrum sp.]|nr:glycosyltransferase family 4 protein [Candidatus Acidoferrum sp.]
PVFFMLVEFKKLAVLHVALNPVTGAWSVMRGLAQAQAASGIYKATGLGVIADSRWPALYRDELEKSGLTHYLAPTPKMFGTAQYFWQRLKRPPIDRWVDDLMARSGADHCIVHFHNAWISGIFLPLICVQQKRATAVATFHGVNALFQGEPLRQRLHQWMTKRLERHHATLTSVDRANLSRAQTVLGMDPKSFQVVPNGVTDTGRRGCPSLANPGSFTVGHVGNIVPAKGWQMVVDAARKLRETGRDVRVILAGRGSEAELAQAMARQNEGWLSYEGFVANPREMVLPKVDALVLMSEQEGLPMAIIEALSMGVPVIATAVGGVPEAVIHGQNGLLVERSVEALAAAIQSLAASQERLRQMSINARRIFEERFEISRVVAMYDKVYRKKE